MNNIENLSISWTTSRARDTYGYNVCHLKSSNNRVSNAHFKTCGGGYDMVGTVVADYFTDIHADSLAELVAKHKTELIDCGYSVPGYQKIPEYYGLTVNPEGGISLDGGCGIESIKKIIAACGFEFESVVNSKGHVIGYLIEQVECEA